MINNKKKKLVMILIGPPGSGKGTQAILLADKLNLFYLETAKIGEERINKAKRGEYILVEGKKYYFADEKKLWQRGKLWSPPFATVLIQDKIKELAKKKQGIVLAGSPRTAYERERIFPILEELYGRENIKIFLIEISVKESVFRNSHRRICELMRHPILYNEETEKLFHCPLDGSKLIKRALDKPEIIKKRYKVYEKETLPLVDFFDKHGLKVHRIRGADSPAKVFKEILKFI